MTNFTIRPLLPGDLLTGRGQPRRELFLSTDGLSSPARRPPWAGFLPWGVAGYGLLGESDIHGPALIYARPRPRRDKWDVVYLAGPADASDDTITALWQALLERLCQEAGRQGVLRVFARLDEQDEMVDPLRRAGFVLYSRDLLWQRAPGPPAASPSEPKSGTLRPQRGADAWGLHSLYRALAPAIVQQSEGLTSRDWRPTGRRWLGNGPRAYVLIVAGEIKGCFRVTEGTTEARLWLLAHPEARPALGTLLPDFGLDPMRTLTVLVPEYGSWVTGLLEGAGFQYMGAQALLVRHTVAWARAPEPRRRPVIKEVLEPAPTTPAAPATAPAGGEQT